MAVINERTSLFDNMRSRRLFSTLRILPRNGKIAWKRRSRPCLALPPALSPSTINNSQLAGLLSEQSANLPGSEKPSRAPLRAVSRTFWTARRVRAAETHFSMMRLASAGFSSSHCCQASPNTVLTAVAATGLTSFSLVCELNCGSRSLTLITAVNPSRTSSPVKLVSFSLSRFLPRA